MHKKFRIFFRTFGGPVDYLDYNLNQNELVEAWISTFDRNKISINEGRFGLEEIDVIKSVRKIIDSYDELKEKFLNKDKNASTKDLYKDNTINQKILNELHTIFHFYHDNWQEFKMKPDHLELLQNLNREIHSLESINSNSFTAIINPCRFIDGVDIDQKWYKKYFNQPHDHGDLTLGYATVGKELLEIVNTNDIDNLKHLSPQKKIRSEFRMIFIKHSPHNVIGIDSLKQWCIDTAKINPNKLSDMELYSFRPKLGRIDTDLSYEQIKFKFLNFTKFYDWEFL